MPQNDKSLLARLGEHDVEFVVIGGVCGVFHGVSLVTFDLDVCCRFSAENLGRLHAAIKDLRPRHRLTAGKLPFELNAELCATLKNLYLETDLGVLDCLSSVTGIGQFDQALAQSVPHKMSFGAVRILSLDALIAAKKTMGRERDLAAVKQLAGIKEKQRSQAEH